MLTQPEKRRVAALAEPLGCRIRAGHRASNPATADSNLRGEDLDSQWEEVFVNADCEFATRLSQLGIDRYNTESYLAFNQWPAAEPFPDWVAWLDRLLGAVPEQPAGDHPTVPFADVLHSVSEAAFSELDTSRRTSFDEQVVSSKFTSWLTERLAGVCSQALYVEFDLFRRAEETPNPTSGGTACYEAFIENLMPNGIVEFIKTYPVAGRLMSVLTHEAVEFATELLTRLERDWDTVVDRLVDECGPAVTGLRLGLGDSHAGGRTVAAIEIGPETIYYKPRDVRPERLYREVSRLLFGPEDAAPRTIVKDGYGWVEGISQKTLDRGAVTEYYRRVGSLLATLYVLNGSDIHYENLVAAGAVPVVVDAETIVTQTLVDGWFKPEQFHTSVLRREVSDSVLGTLLLPYRAESEHGQSTESMSVSGVARIENVEATDETVVWESVNTDEMTFEIDNGEITPSQNYPIVDGEPVLPESHASSVVKGFTQTYDAFRGRLGERLNSLVNGTDVETRYLFRPTSVYQAALNTLVTPRCLRNAAAGSVALDKLVAPIQSFTAEAQESLWPLVRAERTALFQYDVPRFGIDGRDVTFRGETLVKDFFDQHNSAVVSENLDELSDSDRARQRSYIWTALRTDNPQRRLHEHDSQTRQGDEQ